jgi:hypothetical protein
VPSTSRIPAKAGIDFTTDPQFEIRDVSGNLVTTGNFATASVSATLVAGQSGINLRSGTSITSVINEQAVGGVITFDDINLVGTAGANYNLSFAVTAPSNSITTNTQQVTLNAGDPYKLAITTQPACLHSPCALRGALDYVHFVSCRCHSILFFHCRSLGGQVLFYFVFRKKGKQNVQEIVF